MKFHLKTMLATVVLFIACSLVPFFTFSLFKNSFQLEPLNFWRFTPSIPIKEIPMNWIIATIVANVIIAFFAVVAYRIFQKAIQGSWFKKGVIFGMFAVILGVVVPLWSFYTLSNISSSTTWFLILDGTLEYMLYSLLIAFILRENS